MKNNQLYKFLNNYKFIIIILFCLISFVSYSDINNERFKLYGVRDDYCENKGLRKTYGPTMCIFEDGEFDLHKNCRCVDPSTGFCKECYPRVNKPFATLVSKRKWKKMLRESGY
jgi:hypothetical protein